jgi:hypothetical protein
MSTIPPEGDPGLLVCRCASEVELERVEWLWPGRLALGKHTCIAGEPGTGKSQLATFIAAQVSVGGAWPCDEGRARRGSVIILSAEDGEADTIVPRLYAAKADLGRVHIVSAVRTDCKQSRGFNLQADIELLEQKIAELGDVALITIDPISSYLGKTDSHKNAEVRGVLEPLSAMAERARVAVLSVTHFSKAGTTMATKALHRFMGSIAFVGAPRMAFVVLEDGEANRRLFLHAKNNLAAAPHGLAFGLRQTIVEQDKGIVASCVAFEPEPVTITASEAMAAESSGNAKPCDEAESFLNELLADGPVPAKQVKADADDVGLSWMTVRRAKDRLGVQASRIGGIASKGGWQWSLPKVSSPDLTCSSHKVSTLSILDVSQRVPGGKNPKALTSVKGHLSDSSCPRCDGAGCDWCQPEPGSVEPDELGDIPDFLDRRAPTDKG